MSSDNPALPYRSFWMGGFEGADHVNSTGQPLDMALASGHLQHLDADYAHAAALGLTTVRESIGWRLGEPEPGRFDLRRCVQIAKVAQRHGIQVLWSLMHYGTPADVDLLDDACIPRLAAFAGHVARTLAPLCSEPPVYTPVNEIGFLAWAVGETNLMWPYRNQPDGGQGSRRSGYDVKRRLVQAALAAMDAIRREDPRARFLHIEPLVHAVAPFGRPELDDLAATITGYQWHAWDLLAGIAEPELGGSAAALDLIGVNHYAAGQWEVLSEARLAWLPPDPRRLPPAALLQRAWQRYGKPLLLAETSFVGEGRSQWLDHMAAEVQTALAQGTPVAGMCLYPLVDRPDWERAGVWHRSGVFDVQPEAPFERAAHPPYVSALLRWQCRLPQPTEPKNMPTLIVFSHLRWGFVYQRPQHLMTRLAKSHRILFIEEPLPCENGVDTAYWQRTNPAPGVEVWCPRTPLAQPGFHDDQLPALRALVEDLVKDEGIDDPILWFYTPMALPLAAGLQPSAVVYDCMDELSAFKGAPRQLQQREAALMKAADIVLTGGPSLYEARKGKHPNVVCLPSAVDALHFTPARLLPHSIEGSTAARLHEGIARPRIGFFGVIDERMDLALVGHAAAARPDWQWLMAGPVVKIDPASLPQAPNIHWLGMQPYSVLPYLAAQWDVCVMPFAINEATRFISPTKTLEYMAAEKPVVSTAVRDVSVLYGDVVRVAHTADDFVLACQAALEEAAAQRANRTTAMRAAVRRHSWDAGAATVDNLLRAVASQRKAALAVAETRKLQAVAGGA